MYVYLLVGGLLVTTIVPAALRVGWALLRPKIRGAAGEKIVDRHLRKFKGKGFEQARDVMVRTRDKTSQIDNLLISRYGIFVVETKNYFGTIVGRERTPKWIQMLPNSSKKPREFFNPIWQNEGHIRALRGLLGRSYPRVPYYGIVAFADKCRLPKIDGVVNFSELQNTIKDKMKGPPVLSDEDVAAIKKIIENNNIKEVGRQAEHLDNVRSTVAASKERERQAIIRKRREENLASSLAVQAVYSQTRANLENEKVGGEESIYNTRDLDSLIKRADALHSVYAPVIKENMDLER